MVDKWNFIKMIYTLSACRIYNVFLGSPWIEHGTFRSSV
jgi:hypothetical protein